MIDYLTIAEVVEIHDQVIEVTGGAPGIRDNNALEASVWQPLASWEGEELFPTAVEKAAALGFYITAGQPFVDGNKRTGFAAMRQLLRLNGFDLRAPIDEAETAMMAVAKNEADRHTFVQWALSRTVEANRAPPLNPTIDA